MSRLREAAASLPALAPEGPAWASRWTAEGLAWAVRLAECCAEVAVALGIRDEPDALRHELRALLDGPATLYASHPNWPSAMTVLGPPVEISLRLDWGRPAALRLVIDVTDHRADLAHNWRRYLDYARAVVGAAADEGALWGLCQSHLSGISPESRTRMLHGIGYGSGGARRATLYFRNWLETTPTGGHIAAKMSVPAGTGVELIGYDLSGGRIERTKLYCRVTFDTAASMLAAAAPTDPYLGAARGLFDAFGEAAAERSRSSTDINVLQLSSSAGETKRKLFFPCGIWDWVAPEGFLALLGYVQRRLGVGLGPLGSLVDGFIAHGIAISPTYVAVTGNEDSPSVTFYFSPDAVPGTAADPVREAAAGLAPPPPSGGHPVGGAARLARLSDNVADMVAGGLEYLAGLQGDDGLWCDYEVPAGTDTNGGRCQVEGPSTCFVSAYVGVCLAGLASAAGCRGRAAAALRERYRPGCGWGWNEQAPADAETTALAICVIASAGLAAPDDHDQVLLRWQLPDGGFRGYKEHLVGEEDAGSADATGAAVLALLGCGQAGDDLTARAVRRLRLLQDGAGGWHSTWWASDLVATARAVEALEAYAGDRLATEAGPARASVVHAAQALLGWPVPADPFSLGHWLLGWQAAGGDVRWATIHRVVAALGQQQAGDGRWWGAPNRRVPRRIPGPAGPAWDAATVVIDGGCLVTTASVLRGLAALRSAIDGCDG